MSIASEISRLQSAKTDIRNAIQNKGVTVPSNITIDAYPSYIASIPTGGTDYAPELIGRTIASYSNSTISLIGKYAFNDCKFLTEINCPNVTTVSNYAFAGCSMLSTITLSSLYTRVENGAFVDCYSLSSIPYASQISYIGGAAFFGCSGLSAIDLSSCTTISSPVPAYTGSPQSLGAFQHCRNLTSIKLPICTSIGSSAFNNIGITSLDMSTAMPSVTSMGASVFENCSSLSTVKFNNGLSTIPANCFRSCTNLTNVSFGTNVTLIGQSAFYGCSSLSTISFPSSLLSISGYAFQRCANLESVYIPSDVSRVITLAGANAFTNTKLSGTTATGSIYVPNNWLASYQTAPSWSAYSSRMVSY